MLVNNLKIAFRYLKTHKFYAISNFGGLTLGFFCFLLLNFYIRSEQSYDREHGNVFRLLETIQDENGVVRVSAQSGPLVGATAEERFPEIEAVTQIMPFGRITVGNDPASRSHEPISAIDRDFFEVFNFQLKEGDIDEIFASTNGMVITEALAEKYFGRQPALHQNLHTNYFDGIVVGILENFPENTHMDGYVMLPTPTASAVFDFWDEFVSTNWEDNNFLSYMRLRRDADVGELERKITNMAERNWPEEVRFASTFSLQAVQDIHLQGKEVQGEINKAVGNPFYVKVFFWIGLVILLVACFNYAGLLNVAFMGRYREIGVRKAIGANKGQLLRQFFSESFLLTSLSLAGAVSLLYFFKPKLSAWLGTSFDWSYVPMEQIGLLALAGLIISLAAIIYPSWLVSKLATVEALKKERHSERGFSIRKGVTFFQFTAAICLIACSLIFYRQLNFVQTKQLGFDKEGLVTIDINSGILRNQYEAIKSAFEELPEVESVSVSTRVPGEWKYFPFARVITPGMPEQEAREMIFVGSDQDYLNTFNIRLLEGANFTGSPADSSKVILNESAVAALGLSDPVGQQISIPSANRGGNNRVFAEAFTAQVIGVVEDFHFEDLHLAIKPMVIGFQNNPIQSIDYYSLKVNTDDWSNTLAELKAINDRFDPQTPIEYHILNDQLKRFYEADIVRSRLLVFFASIVVFIACLGLFVMTAFTLGNRIKEIGIRKVLGATSTQIVRLIVRDAAILLLGSALLGIILARYAMGLWLEEFAYRIDLHWGYFALAGLLALGIALVTVGLQSLKAAWSNPVESLKSE
jgi:putative ABC transport system permease protein